MPSHIWLASSSLDAKLCPHLFMLSWMGYRVHSSLAAVLVQSEPNLKFCVVLHMPWIAESIAALQSWAVRWEGLLLGGAFLGGLVVLAFRIYATEREDDWHR